MSRLSLDRLDTAFFVALLAFILLYSVLFLWMNLQSSGILPFEDAAILMRYSYHFAAGHGVVWNVGESPVDGCSDFLFMVVLAALIKLGLTAEAGSFAIGTLSHMALIAVVYFSIRKLHGLSFMPAILTAAVVAIGPGLLYVASFWGTPLFGLFAGLTWYFALLHVYGEVSNKISLAFAVSALITGLIRSEGVFLSVFMLLAILYIRGFNNCRRTVMYFTGIFTVIGGAYFIWHWTYFGYPLPNPFYIKGGGWLHVKGLLNSFKNSLFFGSLTIPAFALSLGSGRTRRAAVFVLIPIIGFSSIWILMSPAMNFAGRFQYALLPVFLMSWPLLVNDMIPGLLHFMRWRRNLQMIGIFVLCLAAVAVISIAWKLYITRYVDRLLSRDGRYDVAVMLSQYRDRGYTMAVSEAGLLPLYSGWRTIDAWGLNDKWIAHNDLITESYLDKARPEIIMFHSSYPFDVVSRLNDQGRRYSDRARKWFEMTGVLNDYALKEDYFLAAAYGLDSGAVHYYYVRPRFPESDEIIERIRNMEYYRFGSNRRCKNFATGISIR